MARQRPLQEMAEAAVDRQDDGSLLEAEVEQFEHEARRIARGGLRRALIGLAIGVAAGVAAALVMPREEGPRRRTPIGGRLTSDS